MRVVRAFRYRLGRHTLPGNRRFAKFTYWRIFQARLNPPLDRVFFFGGVELARRGGWLSIAALKIRLMRV